MRIKAKTRMDERNKIAYYRDFEILDELPKIGDVDEVSPEYDGEKTTVCAVLECSIDCEQGNDEIFEYNYYEIVKKFEQLNDSDEWELADEYSEFVAIPKK